MSPLLFTQKAIQYNFVELFGVCCMPYPAFGITFSSESGRVFKK